MGTIAQRRIAGMLALAPPDGGFLGNFKFNRLQASAFVGTVAKRLLGSPSTGTPPIGSGFHFEGEGLGITDFGFFSHIGDTDSNRRKRNPQISLAQIHRACGRNPCEDSA